MGMYYPHERVQLDPGPGRTKQSFSEESNINLIMAKYEKTGMLDHLNTHQGDYGNFIGAQDYHTSMNLIREAGEAFMTIPAGVRAKFDNDPARFLAYVQDPENKAGMVKLGLAHPSPLEVPPGSEKDETGTRVPDEKPAAADPPVADPAEPGSDA